MKIAFIALAALGATVSTAAFAYEENPEAAYPYNQVSVSRETTLVPAYGEPASPSEIRGYKVKGDKEMWESERMGKSGSDGSVDAFQRTGPGRVKAFRSGPDTNR